MAKTKDVLGIAEACVKAAIAKGADAADAVIVDHSNVGVRSRMQKLETIERAEEKNLGIRVLIKADKGFKQAIVSTNDLTEKDIPLLTERAIDMARIAPADPYAGLADEKLLAKTLSDLDLSDAKEPTEDKLQKLAQKTEAATLAVKGVTNSEGADARYGKTRMALVASTGFAKSYESSSCSVSVSAIAGEGTGMETDYEYAVASHMEDSAKPEWIGTSAGERAVRRLKPTKVGTTQVPVIFEYRIARSLLESLSSAINGAMIARGTSFLKEAMNTQVFAKGISIIDDPLMKRAMGSYPFDGEGVMGKKRAVIEDGKLTTWLLDSRSARQLKLVSTGHATRGASSPPRPSSSNLYMEKGKLSVKDLMGDIKNGFFVTEAFGMGINEVTGDYSQGASGFWIENGKTTYSVSEVTIAGNLKDMFLNLTPADDLEFRHSTNSPTVRIEGMTVAGT